MQKFKVVNILSPCSVLGENLIWNQQFFRVYDVTAIDHNASKIFVILLIGAQRIVTEMNDLKLESIIVLCSCRVKVLLWIDFKATLI